DLDDYVLMVAFARGLRTDPHPRYPGEGPAVGGVVAPVDRDEFGHGFKGSQPHRRADLGHLGVGSGPQHLAVRSQAEVDGGTEALGQVRVVGHDSSALEAVEELGSVEAEDLRLAESADGTSQVGVA